MPGGTINWGIRDKSFWNWMELLFVPVVLATAAWFLDVSQTQQQVARENSRIAEANRIEDQRIEEARRIEDERNKIGILNNYRRSITDLISNGGLLQQDEMTDLALAARALTVSTLPQLGGAQKGALLRFLFEIDLIAGPRREKATLDLLNADFSGAHLDDASLNSARLDNANLERADLSDAFLWHTRFYEAFLTEARLTRADLRSADLSGADLRDAYVTEANFLGATGLTCTQLQEARNWESAYRDAALACGQPVPEFVDTDSEIIIEEWVGD
jgi:hypothetical protein